jgi:hypothetical protein
MSPIPPPALVNGSKPDPARMRRVLFRAMIATMLYGASVMIWPRLWRHDLIWLGGTWSLLILISGDGRRYWRLTIPQIHEHVKQGRLRVSLGEKVLGLAAFCLTIYGIGDYF